MKSLTIAGGGIAGLALGIALCRRSVPVRLFEAAAFPRHRVCGEFISGIQTGDLVALGIEDLLAPAERPRETAWFDGARPMFRSTLPEAAYGLSRHYLDTALAGRFTDAGGELQTATRYDGKAVEGTVLATGRSQHTSPWLGLKAHFSNLELGADLEIHLGDASYVGLTRIEEGRVNVSGLFRRTKMVASGQQMLAQAVHDAGLPELAERLRTACIDPASIKGVNRFHLGWQTHRDGAVRIGDAAAIIPPFTGNGMTMALQSALAAVEPLTRWSHGTLSWNDTRTAIRQTQRRMFTARLRWARAFQWMLIEPISRRLCAAMIRGHLVSFEAFYRKVR